MQRPTEKPDFPTALKLLKAKQFEQALSLLKKMNKTPPVLFALSSCYLGIRNFEAARDAMLDIDVKKRTLEHRERLALCYARCKEYPKAFAIYADMKEKSQHAIYDLAFCYCDTGDYTTALQLFGKVDTKTVGLAIGIARCYEGLGRVAEALNIYLDIKQHDVISLISFARCYQNQGQFSKALELLEPIERRDLEVVLALGRCYENCHRFNDAIALYQNYLKKEPNSKQIRHEIARCHRDNQEFSTAVTEFNDLLRVYPNDSNILLSLSLCYENMCEFELAVQTLRRIKEPNGKVQISLGRCLLALERVAEAHAICSKFPENFYEGQLSFAICLSQMQRHEEAISVLKRIPDWQKSKKLLVALARIYFDQNKLPLVFETLKQIPDWEHDEDALMVIARVHESTEDFASAWQALSSIPEAKRNKTVLATFAIFRAKMRDFEAASKYILDIPHYDKNPQLVWQLGSYYQEMCQLDKAIDAYKSLKRENKVKIAMSSCYELAGNFDEMLLCLNSIEPKTKNVLLTIGLAYQRIGLFTQAMETFQKIENWASDTDALLALGICQDVFGNHDGAVAQLTSIRNWEKERKVLLALCRCYQGAGDLRNAVECIYRIPNWKNDNYALLTLAISYNRSGEYQAAKDICIELLARFPYFEDAYLCYAKVKLNAGEANDLPYIENCIQRFPCQAGFYQLKALYEIRLKQPLRAEATLRSAMQRFPFNYHLYVSLLRHYLYLGEYEKAEKIQQTCVEKFRGSPRLAKLCAGIMASLRFTPTFQNVLMSDQVVFHNVELMEPMKEAFAKVSPYASECYIVGSSVLSALERRPLEDQQDIDIVVLTPNLGYFAEHAQTQGLVQNAVMKYLFISKLMPKQSVHLDCYVVTLPIANDSFLLSNSLSRDFTVSCLYLDPEGNVIDPIGCGLQDFRDKILRPIMDPIELFAKDPIRILRAIKYILRGYRPTPELVAALNDWQPSDNFNNVRTEESIRHYLTKQPERFVEVLQRYNLLPKLFGIDPGLTTQEVIKQLNLIANQSTRLWTSSIQAMPPAKMEKKPTETTPKLQEQMVMTASAKQSPLKGAWQKPQAKSAWVINTVARDGTVLKDREWPSLRDNTSPIKEQLSENHDSSHDRTHRIN